jgi:acyl-CoA synthetase (AMP-forming)/AMP-acid ligase II/fructose-1,6-bisphosphatase/inositol monophosphatase family enzyme
VPKTIIEYFENNQGLDNVICEIETGKQLSFDEVFLNASKRMKDFYRLDQKIVIVILPNSIFYIEYLLAVLSSNNIFNPIPYFIGIEELAKVLDYIGPSYIVTERVDIIDKFNGKYRFINPLSSHLPEETFQKKDIDDTLPAALYYSSGTTGDPKGVLYSHKNMVSLITSINRGFHFSKEDNQFAFLPFGHTASINYNILPSLMTGSNLYISMGFEHLRSNFFEVLAKYKITFTEIVPTVLLTLLKLNIDISKYDLNNLRFIGCGSSTLPLTSQKEFVGKYNIRTCNLYGLSETGPSHVDYPLEPGWKPGSIGKPLDVNECKINDDGEILLKGENVFIGYYKNEKLYNQVVKDGWFYTGDIGCERNGKYYFVDRKKDLIIKGGINIVPMEIEEVIYKHDQVHECVVVGKEDNLIGEDIVAVVVPKNKGEEVSLAHEIRLFCKTQLSNYKVPSRVMIWDALPKTHSNKLLRRTVREIINGSINIDFLIKAVQRAGEVAKKAIENKKYSFLSDFEIEKIRKKSKNELVVEEDILSQNIIIEEIKKHDVGAAIYSEELENLEELVEDKSEKKYLIDPLDGTHNFCFGLPFWGISVAILNKENIPYAAIIYLPELDILLKCDGLGHPTMVYMNGTWIQTTTAKKQLEEALICYDNQFYKLGKRAFNIYENLTKACFTTRILGSASADIALIAVGKINARIWNKTNSYDIAGGIPIVNGAGGSVSDFSGNEASIFSKEIIMCSDKKLNNNIVELIKES